MIRVCLTFDIDCTNYLDGSSDEREIVDMVPRLKAVIDNACIGAATWFLRLDNHVAACWGSREYFFERYSSLVSDLRRCGHEIGWHPHCYRWSGRAWVPNDDLLEVAKELRDCGKVARYHGATSVRVGWGVSSNEIMSLLAELGFRVDSSAIPRPRYAWDTAVKDWRATPVTPYKPSRADYRVPGDPCQSILEVPLSTTAVRCSTDSEMVIRYVNLAYHPHIFADAVANWFSANSHLVTITHPYECQEWRKQHALLAFDLRAVAINLAELGRIAHGKGCSLRYMTLSAFSEAHLKP